MQFSLGPVSIMARISTFLMFSAIFLSILVLFAESKPYGFDLSSSEVRIVNRPWNVISGNFRETCSELWELQESSGCALAREPLMPNGWDSVNELLMLSGWGSERDLMRDFMIQKSTQNNLNKNTSRKLFKIRRLVLKNAVVLASIKLFRWILSSNKSILTFSLNTPDFITRYHNLYLVSCTPYQVSNDFWYSHSLTFWSPALVLQDLCEVLIPDLPRFSVVDFETLYIFLTNSF